MKNTISKIGGILVIVVIFGSRVYVAKQQDEDRKKQQHFIEELARQQTEERMQNYQNTTAEAFNNTLQTINLDSLRNAIDSVSKNIKTDQESLTKKIIANNKAKEENKIIEQLEIVKK